jgi:hypothetical protein
MWLEALGEPAFERVECDIINLTTVAKAVSLVGDQGADRLSLPNLLG